MKTRKVKPESAAINRLEFWNCNKRKQSEASGRQAHTPTSWKLSELDYLGFENALVKFGFHEEAIATIVRAVNSHQELRDTLVDLAYYVKDQIKDTALAERVQRVIAKAEGVSANASMGGGK